MRVCVSIARSGHCHPEVDTIKTMNEVTSLLSAIEQGEPKAAEQLLPLVYDELRKLAALKLAQEKPGQTLQRRPWFTRRTFGWSTRMRSSTGTAGAISSQPLPRRCGGSSSKAPAA